MFENLKAKYHSEGPFNKMIKWGLTLVILLLLVWAVRACTGSSGSKKQVYYIGRASSWYPLQLLGREKNLVAFTNDILSLIGSENDLIFQWVEANPQTLVEGLLGHNYDFIITIMRPNIVNEDQYDFSELIYNLGPVLIVRQDSKVTSLEEMSHKTIGIPTGMSPVFNAVRAAGANNFDLFVITYDNMNRAMDALVTDQIDGAIMPALPAYTLTHGLHAGQLKVVTAPFTDEGLRLVSLKKSMYEEIIDLIDSSLDEMRSNGTYDALIAKWGLVDAETGYWHPPETP